MLRFSTESFRDVTYFDSDGERMLEGMGCSGRVPGALKPEDLPQALERLRAAVSAAEKAESTDDGEDEESEDPPQIGFRQRVNPLLELLAAAIAAEDHVTWRRA